MPPTVQAYTPQMVFCTQLDGFSLKTLLSHAESYPEPFPSLLLIQTELGSTVGAYLGSNLRTRHKYQGTSDAFLFSLDPPRSFWHSSGRNEMYVFVSQDSLLFGGGGAGPGLTLDSTLCSSSSFQCETFNNCALSHSLCVHCEYVLFMND